MDHTGGRAAPVASASAVDRPSSHPCPCCSCPSGVEFFSYTAMDWPLVRNVFTTDHHVLPLTCVADVQNCRDMDKNYWRTHLVTPAPHEICR
jgi:hypothetical protein